MLVFRQESDISNITQRLLISRLNLLIISKLQQKVIL